MLWKSSIWVRESLGVLPIISQSILFHTQNSCLALKMGQFGPQVRYFEFEIIKIQNVAYIPGQKCKVLPTSKKEDK